MIGFYVFERILFGRDVPLMTGTAMHTLATAVASAMEMSLSSQSKAFQAGFPITSQWVVSGRERGAFAKICLKSVEAWTFRMAPFGGASICLCSSVLVDSDGGLIDRIRFFSNLTTLHVLHRRSAAYHLYLVYLAAGANADGCGLSASPHP